MGLSGKPVLLVAAFLVLTAPGVPPHPGEAAAPRQVPARFDGVWAGDWGSQRSKAWRIRIDSGSFRAEVPGTDQWYEGRVAVREDREPAEIDFEISDCNCSDQGKTSRSIFRWDDGMLVLETPQAGAPRPRKFSEGEENLLFLQRSTSP